jgi:phosphoserine phosphatase RsbU/P
MANVHLLKCAETWAGNESDVSVAQLPGLTVSVHSRVFEASDAGGDVHYVSVCPNCMVSRVALADVSGHGFAVRSMGITLRKLMQKHLAALDQAHLMSDLNEAVMRDLEGIHYATMVAVGFHGRRGLLVLTNAGHPPPLWYRVDGHDWEWLEPRRAVSGTAITGTPLGLLPDVSYGRMVIKPSPGDLVVMYSDGVSEAASSDGEELGRDRLISMARSLCSRTAETFGVQLVDAVNEFRGGVAPADDETIIVLQALARLSD